MNKDLISVIIPVYNAAKWLRQSCESVFSQDYPNVELILIDDGSTDESPALCDEIAKGHENARVLHTENGGVCCARNHGLSLARGAYISFLDADDLLTKDALSRLFRALSEQNADLAIGYKTNMREDGQLLGCPYQREHAVWENEEALIASLSDHPATYAVWGKLYRKELIGKTRFVEGRKVHEDSFFLFECLAKAPKVVLIEDCILQYRLSEGSASRARFSEKFFDILYFEERKEEIVREKHPALSDLLPNLCIKANLALLRNLTKADATFCAAERACIRAVRRQKRHFVPATELDTKFFFLVTHHLYYPYKLYCKLRSKG